VIYENDKDIRPDGSSDFGWMPGRKRQGIAAKAC
jgi:hypothetical protein